MSERSSDVFVLGMKKNELSIRLPESLILPTEAVKNGPSAPVGELT